MIFLKTETVTTYNCWIREVKEVVKLMQKSYIHPGKNFLRTEVIELLEFKPKANNQLIITPAIITNLRIPKSTIDTLKMAKFA